MATEATSVVGVQFVVTPGMKPASARAGKMTSGQAVQRSIDREAGKSSGGSYWGRQEAPKPKPTLDGIWSATEEMTDLSGPANAWMTAALRAWSQHHPLEIRPDHTWLLILQALTTHIENNAEALRSKYVMHEGKKELLVHCDHFVKGGNNDWSWCIDQFSGQIDQNVTENAGEVLRQAYTTTTPVTSIATKVTVMDSLKKYFSYRMSTRCGFPYIRLAGTEEDWVRLRQNAERLLTELTTPDFAKWWGPALFDVLDRFVGAYRKAAAGTPLDESEQFFWNSMIKRGAVHGSGGYSFFAGWFNIFFPFTDGSRNRYCEPYREDAAYVQEQLADGMKSKKEEPDLSKLSEREREQMRWQMRRGGRMRGGDINDYPSAISAAPVKWSYYSKTYPMEFRSGFVGVKQDAKDGCLSPVVGWWIVDLSPEVKADSADADKTRRLVAERSAWSRNDIIEVLVGDSTEFVDGKIVKLSGSEVSVVTAKGPSTYQLYGKRVRAKAE